MDQFISPFFSLILNILLQGNIPTAYEDFIAQGNIIHKLPPSINIPQYLSEDGPPFTINITPMPFPNREPVQLPPEQITFPMPIDTGSPEPKIPVYNEASDKVMPSEVPPKAANNSPVLTPLTPTPSLFVHPPQPIEVYPMEIIPDQPPYKPWLDPEPIDPPILVHPVEPIVVPFDIGNQNQSPPAKSTYSVPPPIY